MVGKPQIAALLLALIAVLPSAQARAQETQQAVRINVIVTNAETGAPVPFQNVSFNREGSACTGGRAEQAQGQTRRSGEAAFEFYICTGPVTVTVDGGAEYDSQSKTLVIEPGVSGYNVFFKLQPKGRVVHIRVQGRMPDGSLVGVPAAIYDRDGHEIAVTDSNGSATANIHEVIGETVTLRAQAAARWGSATSSYVAGASEGGTRIMRSDDYVNFVLKGEQQNEKQEVNLISYVYGMRNGARVPIDNALIYDNEGHYIASTDGRGRAVARIEAALGETLRIRAEAHRWKTQTQSVLVRERGNLLEVGNASLTLYARFVLEPNENETEDLTVEVLDRNTDKPVSAAAVRLYRPSGYPGTLVGFESTDHKGEVVFDAAHVDRAVLDDNARVSVTHGGYESAVETVHRSLTTSEGARYVVYLKAKQEKTNWSGTWTEGPYTIQISGGTGSLGFTTLRADGVGGCCPLVDQGSGSCQVIGSKATCQWHAHYTDSAKDVVRSGYGTLTLSGDYIQYDMHQTTGTIKLTTGVCPDINQCTAMHPGAEFTGTWTRKKP